MTPSTVYIGTYVGTGDAFVLEFNATGSGAISAGEGQLLIDAANQVIAVLNAPA